jgi:branched-subunit amino acid ABC-type transport system permease component
MPLAALVVVVVVVLVAVLIVRVVDRLIYRRSDLSLSSATWTDRT